MHRRNRILVATEERKAWLILQKEQSDVDARHVRLIAAWVAHVSPTPPILEQEVGGGEGGVL